MDNRLNLCGTPRDLFLFCFRFCFVSIFFFWKRIDRLAQCIHSYEIFLVSSHTFRFDPKEVRSDVLGKFLHFVIVKDFHSTLALVDIFDWAQLRFERPAGL